MRARSALNGRQPLLHERYDKVFSNITVFDVKCDTGSEIFENIEMESSFPDGL